MNADFNSYILYKVYLVRNYKAPEMVIECYSFKTANIQEFSILNLPLCSTKAKLICIRIKKNAQDCTISIYQNSSLTECKNPLMTNIDDKLNIIQFKKDIETYSFVKAIFVNKYTAIRVIQNIPFIINRKYDDLALFNEKNRRLFQEYVRKMRDTL